MSRLALTARNVEIHLTGGGIIMIVQPSSTLREE